MTEDRFKELVSLFLDNEISPENLAELETEISRNPERRAQFTRSCQIDRAMRMAFDSAGGGRRRRRLPLSVSALVFGGALAAAFVLGSVLMPMAEQMLADPDSAESAAAERMVERFDADTYRVHRRILIRRAPESPGRPVQVAGFELVSISPDAVLSLHNRGMVDGVLVRGPDPLGETEVLCVSEFGIEALFRDGPARPVVRQRVDLSERIPEPAIHATLIGL